MLKSGYPWLMVVTVLAFAITSGIVHSNNVQLAAKRADDGTRVAIRRMLCEDIQKKE